MTNELEQAVLDLLEEGEVLQAIKLYRERTGAGLKASSTSVAEIAARHANASGLASDEPRGESPFQGANASSSISRTFTPSADYDLPNPTSEEGMSLGALVFLGVAAAVTAWFLAGG